MGTEVRSNLTSRGSSGVMVPASTSGSASVARSMATVPARGLLNWLALPMTPCIGTCSLVLEKAGVAWCDGNAQLAKGQVPGRRAPRSDGPAEQWSPG